MRLTIDGPVPGVAHSLQDKQSRPYNARASATGEPLSFDFHVRVADGPKFYGELVRSEGPVRRFVYIAVGKQAGDPDADWDRRMKIDIHDIPQPLLDAAIAGGVLEGAFAGKDAKGGPACATIRPVRWRVVQI